MTTPARQPHPQKWYRISETQLINLKDAPKQEQADEMAENIKRQRIKIDHEGIHTSPPAPTQCKYLLIEEHEFSYLIDIIQQIK